MVCKRSINQLDIIVIAERVGDTRAVFIPPLGMLYEKKDRMSMIELLPGFDRVLKEFSLFMAACTSSDYSGETSSNKTATNHFNSTSKKR